MPDTRFADLVDIKQLQKTMALLYDITGVPTTILDRNGKFLIKTGWQDLCSGFHRSHPEASKLCQANDEFIVAQLDEKDHVAHVCENGLWYVGIPVIIAGKNLASLIFGQFMFVDEKPDLEFFRKQAGKYGFNEEKYLEALQKIPVFEKEKIQSLTDYYSSFVSLISIQGYNYMALAEEVENRRQAEEALEWSEKRFRAIADYTYGWESWVGVDGTLIWTNPAVERITGYTVEEYMNMENPFETLTHEDDRERMKQHLIEAVANKASGQEIQYRIKCKDGSFKWISLSYQPIFSQDGTWLGIRSSRRDISKFKSTENSLQQSEERFRTITENAPDFIIQVDNEGTILFINRPFPFNNKDESVGSNVFNWGDSSYRDIFRTSLDAVFNERNTLEFEVESPSADNEPRWFYCRAAPVIDEGEIKTAIITATDITERKAVEHSLLESEDRFRSFVENANDIIFCIDQDCTVSYISPNWSEFMGHKITDILEKSYVPFVHEDDLPIYQQFFEKIRLTGEKQSGAEYRVRHQDGSYRWQRTNASPVKNEHGEVIAYIGIARDVTKSRKISDELEMKQCELEKQNEELLKAKRELETARDKYSDLYDTAPVGYLTVGREREIIEANLAGAELLGVERDELLGRNIDEFVNLDDHPDFMRKTDGTCLCESQQGLEIKMYKVSGEPFHALLKCAPEKNEKGEIISRKVIISDITDLKLAEEERKKLEVQVLQTQKLESLGVLAGGIAHDFNNLLMGILGNADLALDEIPSSSPAYDNIADVVTTAKRAAELSRQMLAYSGRGKFELVRIDLSEIAHEMASLLEVSISKKVVLKYEFDTSIEPIRGDSTQIRQVIMNLITNASEAIGDNNGVITLATGTRYCDQEFLSSTYIDENLSDGNYSYIMVTDTGSGMDSETWKRIFDPFFTTKFTGRGLGLAAVLGIIRGHQGAIIVDTELGRGVSFSVYLPVVEVLAESQIQEPMQIDDWHGIGTVLLVDDEEAVRAVGKRMLEKAGFTVETAEDGLAALELFRNCSEDITCILLDLTMPKMDGEEALAGLRKIRSNVPVIISSGYNEQDIAHRFKGEKLAGYIQKPYEYNSLMCKMREVLEK